MNGIRLNASPTFFRESLAELVRFVLGFLSAIVEKSLSELGHARRDIDLPTGVRLAPAFGLVSRNGDLAFLVAHVAQLRANASKSKFKQVSAETPENQGKYSLGGRSTV
jgi:hypothetical protein